VIPKRPVRTIFDIAPDDLAHLHKVVQKIAKAASKAFNADGITIHQFNERAGGQVVFHLHVHVLPRHMGEPLKPAATFAEEPAVLAEQAEKLAAAIAAG
jgi:histidine triad (HIT) family protein